MVRPQFLFAILLAPLGACAPTSDAAYVQNEVQLLRAAAPAEAMLEAMPGCRLRDRSCTPSNLGGRIYNAVVMWGELGPEAYGIALLGAENLEREGSYGGTLDFSLVREDLIVSEFEAPPAGTREKRIPRVEFNYDYLDATFSLEDGPLAGEYTIRTVFVTSADAEDASESMRRGDKLIRLPGESEFRWCHVTGCQRARGADVIQDRRLVEHIHPGQGNPHYIPFSIPVRDDIWLTGDELATSPGRWTLAFDMTGAVVFDAPVRSLETIPELLDAFRLSYDPSPQQAGEQTTIAVDLDYRH